MIPDSLGIAGDMLEIALFAAVVTLLVAAFLIGRLLTLRQQAALETSNAAMTQIRQEEQVRLDELRKEKDSVLKEAIRAEDNISRWKEVKEDHENLKLMQEELDAFEREESNRIDELERKRVDAARRLFEIQSALDTYPPEIIGEEEQWQGWLDERKKAIDSIERLRGDTQSEIDELESKVEKMRDEVSQLQEKREELNRNLREGETKLNATKEEIALGQRKIEALGAATEVVNGATIQFPDEALSVSVKEDSAKTPSSSDKLGMFRVTPDCLRTYEHSSADRSEEEMLADFESELTKCNLNYPTQIVRAFHTALKVNDLSPLTVLSGLSGTGKSQLPRAYARYFGIHFLHVPVEPGWDSPQDLLGFYDFVAERYRPTDRARALGHFDGRFAADIGIDQGRNWEKRMLIVLLDEMNLARTEYYFSEFLSRLEMRGPRNKPGAEADARDNRNDAQIAIDLPYAENEVPKQLYVPYNVLWVGTLNEDETTQALSDKVLDRANSIRFAPPEPSTLRRHSAAPKQLVPEAEGHLPYVRWLEWSTPKLSLDSQSQEIDETLERLAELMQMAGRGFGYRITQSIKAYISRYPGQDWRAPMIDQINMRLLPKLNGAEMSDCYAAVEDLRKLTQDELGNPSFASALGEAEKSAEATQIFNWPGYTYEEKASQP